MQTWIAVLASGAVLWAQAPDYSAPFAQVFSSAPESDNPDSGRWSGASHYLEAAFSPIVGEGRRHLREKHGLDVDMLQVPNDSSEANGRRIAEYLRFSAILPSLGCASDVMVAARSLNRGERRAFLTRHPNAPVPSYSLVAVSNQANTSKALLNTWLLLSFFSPREDGRSLAKDCVLPGVKYLGGALIEALLRFAIADLEGK
jgi:hypothetical protein